MSGKEVVTESQMSWLRLLDSAPEAATYWMTDQRYRELRALDVIDHNGLTPAGRALLKDNPNER